MINFCHRATLPLGDARLGVGWHPCCRLFLVKANNGHVSTIDQPAFPEKLRKGHEERLAKLRPFMTTFSSQHQLPNSQTHIWNYHFHSGHAEHNFRFQRTNVTIFHVLMQKNHVGKSGFQWKHTHVLPSKSITGYEPTYANVPTTLHHLCRRVGNNHWRLCRPCRSRHPGLWSSTRFPPQPATPCGPWGKPWGKPRLSGQKPTFAEISRRFTKSWHDVPCSVIPVTRECSSQWGNDIPTKQCGFNALKQHVLRWLWVPTWLCL